MISEILVFVVGDREALTFGINPPRLWIFFSFDFRHMVYQIFPRLNELIFFKKSQGTDAAVFGLSFHLTISYKINCQKKPKWDIH